MARVRSTVERAANLHRQAVAVIDAAAGALDGFASHRPPAFFEEELRKLSMRLNEAAVRSAPGWLGEDMDSEIADTQTGTATGTMIPVRVGTAFPSSDVSFPVLVPLLGAGSLTIEPTKDV